jgi:uncharacterized protein GlcG (DUF336 family)
MQSSLKSKQTLPLAVAKTIAAAAEAEAIASGLTVVIVLVDDGGHLIYLQRMDGTQLGSTDIAIAKAASAVKFKRTTKIFEDSLVAGRQAILALPGAMPVEGGIPFMSCDTVIGAIGVSGARADEDGLIAQAGVAVFEQLL